MSGGHQLFAAQSLFGRDHTLLIFEKEISTSLARRICQAQILEKLNTPGILNAFLVHFLLLFELSG